MVLRGGRALEDPKHLPAHFGDPDAEHQQRLQARRDQVTPPRPAAQAGVAAKEQRPQGERQHLVGEEDVAVPEQCHVEQAEEDEPSCARSPAAAARAVAVHEVGGAVTEEEGEEQVELPLHECPHEKASEGVDPPLQPCAGGAEERIGGEVSDVDEDDAEEGKATQHVGGTARREGTGETPFASVWVWVWGGGAIWERAFLLYELVTSPSALTLIAYPH